MAGGREVGRVSVRVVPDTDGFGAAVRRELQGIGDQEVTVDVKFDVDRAQIRAELEAIRVPTIHVPVELDTAGVARDMARLEALTRDQTVKVGTDLDTARLRTQIAAAAAAARTSVPVTTDVDSSDLARLRAELLTLRDQRVRVKVDVDSNPLRTAVSAMAGLSSVALSTVSNLASVTGGFVKIAGVAGAVAIGGAGITAAFGAAATAVAAVPAALGLAAAPIGAIIAGLDGIKAAAKSLEPAFDRLQSQVSGVFEKGLTPVFQSLDGLVRGTLTDGLKGTATSINGVASSLADMLNAMNRADQLGNIFRNINKAIADIGPGIVQIVNSTLRMMELTGGYDALTTAVNEFGRAYSDSVTRIIGDGSIARAFTGLESVLGSLSRAFVGLVENGIRGFAGAAPGISKVVDSLTGFFGRFDWERLGRASGAVFEGIGQIFDNVDDATIESITQAFERLGGVFQSADFQASIGKIVDALPALIDGFSWFVENGATVAGWIADIVSAFGGDNIAAIAVGGAVAAAVWKGLKAASKLWKLKDLFGKGLSAKDVLPGGNPLKLLDLFDKAFKWTDLLGPAGDLASGLLRELLGLNSYTIEIDEGDLKEKVSNALDEAFQESLDGVFDDLPEISLAVDAEPARQSIADAVSGGVADGLSRVDTSGLAAGFALTLDTGGVTGALAEVRTAFTTALTDLHTQTTAGMAAVSAAFTTGMSALGESVAAGFASVQTAFQAGLAALPVGVADAFTQISAAFQTGLAGLSTAVTAQMELVRLAFVNPLVALPQQMLAQLVALQQAFVNGMLMLQNTVTLGMQQIVLAFTTPLQSLPATLTPQFALIQQAFVNGMLMAQNTVTLAMAQIQASVLAGMSQIVAATQFGMQSIVVTVQQSMLSITVAVQTAVAQILATVQAGFAQLPTAVATGMAQAVAAVTSGFASIVSGAVSGMGQYVSTVASGVSQAVEKWIDGAGEIGNALDRLTQSIFLSAETSISGYVSRVASGVGDVVSAWLKMVGACVDAVASLIPGMQDAGTNAVSALAAAISNGASAVISAAAAVASRAIAAAKSALGIASPSREFLAIGDFVIAGFVKGLDSDKPAKEMRRLADSVIAEAERIAGAAAASPTFSAGFDTSRINARFEASIGGLGVPVGSTASGATQNFYINVNGGDNEPTADAVARVTRRQAALGLFG